MRNLLPFFLLLTFSISKNNIYGQLLIRNVNVLDVENRKMLQGYDVVSNNTKIISVQKSKADRLIPGATIIDGTGKYLIPGLTDAHVHFFQSGGLYARPDAIDLRKYQPYSKEIKWVHDNMEDFLRRYVSAGITSVIDVGSSFNFLAQRDSFANKNYAPVIAMTGPLLTTYVPEPYKNLGQDGPFIEIKTEDGAREAVKEQIAHKADFIKIWYIVLENDIEAGARKNLAYVKAAIDEAHKNNLRVAVHATERITTQLAVEAGADFLVHDVDNEIVGPEFIALLKKNNTVLCPTLVVADGYEKTFSNTYKFSADELALANPFCIGSILDFPFPDTSLGARYIKTMTGVSRMKFRAHADSVQLINLQKLYTAGVTIASGTDAGNIGTQHASSYFNELKAMHDAGYTLWDLLVASTINGAKAVGRQQQWGSISKGKDANMVLLNANPIDSLSNWRKIDAVINKGSFLQPDSIIPNTPELLVQQQLNAYNAHNLEAFLNPYSEDVEVYNFPDKLISKGKDKMRTDYQFTRMSPGLYCRLINRIVQGNIVIDHEEIHVTGRKPFNSIAIYKIENGKISKVYFPQ